MNNKLPIFLVCVRPGDGNEALYASNEAGHKITRDAHIDKLDSGHCFSFASLEEAKTYIRERPEVVKAGDMLFNYAIRVKQMTGKIVQGRGASYE